MFLEIRSSEFGHSSHEDKFDAAAPFARRTGEDTLASLQAPVVHGTTDKPLGLQAGSPYVDGRSRG